MYENKSKCTSTTIQEKHQTHQFHFSCVHNETLRELKPHQTQNHLCETTHCINPCVRQRLNTNYTTKQHQKTMTTTPQSPNQYPLYTLLVLLVFRYNSTPNQRTTANPHVNYLFPVAYE